MIVEESSYRGHSSPPPPPPHLVRNSAVHTHNSIASKTLMIMMYNHTHNITAWITVVPSVDVVVVSMLFVVNGFSVVDIGLAIKIGSVISLVHRDWLQQVMYRLALFKSPLQAP